ncbi:hypothetical protein ACNFBT_17475 [Pseudomonas sp. NY15181]|uniref:hypothetical protein n=1 Tax=Pseudomonas sp. NY15181 TaxID=3400349 RepID=UPI003A87B412
MLLKFHWKFKSNDAWKKEINTIGDISEGRIKLLPGLTTYWRSLSGKPAGCVFMRTLAASEDSPAALPSSLICSGSANGDRFVSDPMQHSKTKLPPEFE